MIVFIKLLLFKKKHNWLMIIENTNKSIFIYNNFQSDPVSCNINIIKFLKFGKNQIPVSIKTCFPFANLY